jgi:hypothetical protein
MTYPTSALLSADSNQAAPQNTAQAKQVVLLQQHHMHPGVYKPEQ